MNQEIRDMIGNALRDEPPMGVHREQVLRTGRRRVRLRRAGIAGGAALGVVAVAMAAVTVSGRLPTGPASDIATAPTSTGMAATSPPDGGACTAGGPPGSQRANPPDKAPPTDPKALAEATDPKALAEAARLTEAFARFAFPAPPGVTVPPIVLCAAPGQPGQPPLSGQRAGGGSWLANMTLRAPSGERAVLIEVRPRAGQPAGECVNFPGGQCRVDTLSDGTALLSVQKAPDANTPVVNNVTAWRADNTVVSVMETGTEAPAGQKAVPPVLTEADLIKIATAPELKTEFTGPVPTQPAEPSDRRARELSEVLAQANLLPAGMRAAKVPTARTEPLAFYVSQGGYKLNADLVDAAGEGNLFVNIGTSGPRTVSCADFTAGECTSRALPDGNTAIVVITRDYPGQVGTMLTVSVSRADGTSISAAVRNVSERAEFTGEKNTPPLSGPTRPEPPLDVDTLIRIVTLPGLHW